MRAGHKHKGVSYNVSNTLHYKNKSPNVDLGAVAPRAVCCHYHKKWGWFLRSKNLVQRMQFFQIVDQTGIVL